MSKAALINPKDLKWNFIETKMELVEYLIYQEMQVFKEIEIKFKAYFIWDII